MILGDNLEVLPRFADGSFQLIYIDPPFNTGRTRTLRTIRTTADRERRSHGVRRTPLRAAGRSRSPPIEDEFDDYLAFLEPRLREARRLLAESGTLYVHLDYREAHYVKLLLDELFGRDCFLNELIWAYDYGGKPRRRWPAKHDTILVYVKDPDELLLRLRGGGPRALHGAGPRHAREGRPRQAARRTSGGTRSCRRTGAEKTGYPTQKPEGVVRRIVQASSRPGDWCLDFFAGSGTLGAVAAQLGRRYVLVDDSAEAVARHASAPGRVAAGTAPRSGRGPRRTRAWARRS